MRIALCLGILLLATRAGVADGFQSTPSTTASLTGGAMEDSNRSSHSPPTSASSLALSAVSTKAASKAAAASAQAEAPPLKQTRPRKICLMVEPTPFTHVSGYANRFNEMLRYLSKAGDFVEIVTADAQTDPKELPTERFGYNIYHTLGFTFPLYRHITLTFDLPEMMGKQVLDRFKPDVIHATSPGFFLFAAIFYARVFKIPLVMSYHTHLPTYGKNYLSFVPGVEECCWTLLRMAHAYADLTLVTSPQMKEELEANGIERVDVWRKGIDTVRFHPNFRSAEMRSKMTNGHPNDFLLVYVGRLGLEKRLKDLKPVLEGLGKNARLCIVGKGPQQEELQEYFAGTNTVFTGQLSGDELSAAFASADVFCMPSDSETLGFVVLESMASGVPVIGARAGGIPDIIQDGETGFLVPVGNVNAYVERLQRLQRDPAFRSSMGKQARAEAEKWGWEAATSVLRNVQYEKALVNFHRRIFVGQTQSFWKRMAKAVTLPFRGARSIMLVLATCFVAQKSKKEAAAGSGSTNSYPQEPAVASA